MRGDGASLGGFNKSRRGGLNDLSSSSSQKERGLYSGPAPIINLFGGIDASTGEEMLCHANKGGYFKYRSLAEASYSA